MNSYFLTSLAYILLEVILYSSIIFCILKLASIIFFIDQPKFWFRVWNIFLLGMLIIFVQRFVSIIYHNTPSQQTFSTVYSSSHSNIKYISDSITLKNSIHSLIAIIAPWMAVIYCIGLLYKFIYLSSSILTIQKIKSTATVKNLEYLQFKVKQLCAEIPINKHIGIIISSSSKGVYTVNHLKPLIILPLSLLNNLTPDQVESILIHELAHIKRNDYLMNFIQKIIETILVFNPIVFFISVEIDKYREFCCDDFVVTFTNRKKDYSVALYRSILSQKESGSIIMAATGYYKFQLLDRIKRINGKQTIYPFHQKTLLLLLAGILISIVITSSAPAIVVAAQQSFSVKKSRLYSAHFQSKSKKLNSRSSNRPITKSGDTPTSEKQNHYTFGSDTSWSSRKHQIEAKTDELKRLAALSDTSIEAEQIAINQATIKSFYASEVWLKTEHDLLLKTDSLHDLVKQHLDYNRIEQLGLQIAELSKQENLLKEKHGVTQLSNKIQQLYNSPGYLKKQKTMYQLGQEIQAFYEGNEWENHETNKVNN